MQKHYMCTSQSFDRFGHRLYRIRALKNLPQHGVKRGDLGGWVEGSASLGGSAWVADEAEVYGNAKVYENALVYGDAWVCGGAQVYGNAKVGEDAVVYGNAEVYGCAHVLGKAEVFDAAKVFEDAVVSGFTRVAGNAWVRGRAELHGDLWVHKHARIAAQSDFLCIGPLAPFGQRINLFRTGNKQGYVLEVGFWSGTLPALPEQLKRWAENEWAFASEEELARWLAEYRALLPFLRQRILLWRPSSRTILEFPEALSG
ncbi:hypothetical protein [Corynebacterium freiburgense]|uniref:hypothetical protein n=1 Tax=Corynebacterium freiburgense TaxID=556548 RepID=UPI0006853B2E|nr:hypothetical protein [Corynebacterium freiburgense]WJZ03389.1 hypothetical protein CFREI_10575 [Corynebacterium freiburgense]